MYKDIDVAGIMYKIRDEFDYCALPKELLGLRNNKSNNLTSSSYVKELVEKYQSYENIVVFGSGTYGKQVFDILEARGIKSIWCFCDNQIRDDVEFINGKRVLNVSDAVSRFPDALYVITPKFASNTIFRQLIKMGIPVEQISFFVLGYI